MTKINGFNDYTDKYNTNRCALIAFCLLGHYPKPIEFFKMNFEEATPLANN